MEQPTFHTVVEKGKPVARYGLQREVGYLEQFCFWSANELPEKLWRPRYHGHAIIESVVASIAIRTHTMLGGEHLQSAIVEIDPALQDYAHSNDVVQRMAVGSIVVQQAIHEYLQGGLTTSDDARSEFVAMHRDPDYSEQLRRLGVSAL